MSETVNNHDKYQSMSPRQRHLEFRRLVYEGFPEFGLMGSIDEQPKELDLETRVQQAIYDQNQVTSRRLHANSEYRNTLFSNVGDLLGFAPVTDSFRIVANKILTMKYSVGVLKDIEVMKPRNRELSAVEALRLFGEEGIDLIFSAKDIIDNARNPHNLLELNPRDEFSLLIDRQRTLRGYPKGAGIFDKKRAKTIEKEVYRAGILQAVIIETTPEDELGNLRDRNLREWLDLRYRVMMNQLEELKDPEETFPHPHAFLQRWKREYSEHYGQELKV